MGNYKVTGNYKPDAGTSQLTELGITELGTAGTELKVDGLSIDLSTGSIYSKVIAVWSIIAVGTISITAKINNGSSYNGNTYKLGSGAETLVGFAATATIPISLGVSSVRQPGGTLDLFLSSHSGGTDSISCHWNWSFGTDCCGWGGGKLITTATTTLTEFTLTGSGNMGVGSTLTLYGLKKST